MFREEGREVLTLHGRTKLRQLTVFTRAFINLIHCWWKCPCLGSLRGESTGLTRCLSFDGVIGFAGKEGGGV